MKILVIGSGGMLGHMTTLYLKNKGYCVTDISRSRKCNNDTILFDVLNVEMFNSFFNNNDFDYVINCAAILPKECEYNKKGAILLNSYFPHFLEDYYKNKCTKIIQVSTGGVFMGSRANYSETDPCDTQIFYGRTKLLGEINNSKDLTIRSDFVGPDMSVKGSGLFNWVMNSTGTIKGYSKAYFNGVTSLEFAKFIEKAVSNQWNGIYHLYTSDVNSKADFARNVCRIFEKEDLNVEDNEQVRVNMSLITARADVNYSQKTMNQQLIELKEWIVLNSNLYKHYFEKR